MRDEKLEYVFTQKSLLLQDNILLTVWVEVRYLAVIESIFSEDFSI